MQAVAVVVEKALLYRLYATENILIVSRMIIIRLFYVIKLKAELQDNLAGGITFLY